MSFFFTLLTGGRLALAIHLRNQAKVDTEKQQEETRFWVHMMHAFGHRSMAVKKPQLPTYGHAVRQAVLKRGTEPGDVHSKFHNISAEEMELERIRKMGGAPPGEISCFQLILHAARLTALTNLAYLHL